MKEIVLKVYKFDELSKDSQEKIIERERWNVMEQCMDAYSVDYKKSMKAFEDMTDTEVYDWEVGYERYDFSYEFKYNDPIYEHPTDYNRDIFPKNLCGKLLFRYINNNIMPHITKGKYYSIGKYIDGKYNYKCRRSRVILGYEDNCPLTGMCYDYYLVTDGESISMAYFFKGWGKFAKYHKYPHPFYDDGVVKLYMPIPPISLALEGDRGILNIGEFKRKEIDYEQK